MREHGEPTGETAGGLGFLERGDQVGQRAVVDAPAALRGGDGEADRQVRLAHAGRAEKHHVLLALDEAELVQALDLLALDRGLEGEVEVAERLDRRQPRGAHRGLQPAVVAQGDLAPSSGSIASAAASGRRRCSRRIVIERFQRAGHLEIGEHVPRMRDRAACARRRFIARPPREPAYRRERAALDARRRAGTRAGRAGCVARPASSSERYGRGASGWSRARSSRSKRTRGRSPVVPMDAHVGDRASSHAQRLRVQIGVVEERRGRRRSCSRT